VSEANSLLARGVLAGDRRSLARAITLVESNRPEDEPGALGLLRELAPFHTRGMRVGVSGPPGVGKSSLLEKLGMHLIASGRRPAVLVVDPTSQRSGGSILGDKTRMAELARQASAYVRPSPSGEQSGGVARATGDVLMLCEVAGFSPALVETVGVGQAETAVTNVVDLLLLLLEPGAGDELQGIKRGLFEWGDVIAVNKADGARAELARQTSIQFGSALAILRSQEAHPPPVLSVSALAGAGITELWQALTLRYRELELSGALEAKRSEQRRAELYQRLAAALMRQLLGDSRRATELAEVERQVMAGELLAGEAVRRLLQGD
jgi:LAO/AO transport system kinase